MNAGTATDFFCGAGGSSIGLHAAGFNVKLAANHWDRAIETHSANFADTEHLIADISNYDMRRLPRTDLLWASPECTWHSPAGGRKRVRAQLDLMDDYVATDGGVRSRATAFDVIRAAEAHGYKVIIVENVLEFADWPMFDWWLSGLKQLGYTCQLISVSSAHVGGPGNDHAPQWRDRLYIFCTAAGIKPPNVSPRPAAWCFDCGEPVSAVQAWKRLDRRPVGKYGQQYVYRCPNQACRFSIVEPFVRPAAAAIDWSDTGQRIGDRSRPLAAATVRRIEAGLRLFAQPTMVSVNHDSADGRAYLPGDRPFPTRSTKIGDGLASPALLVPAGGTWNDDATSVNAPMRTRTTRDAEGLCTPQAFIAEMWGTSTVRPVTDPLATIAAGGNHHGLTVPPGAFIQKHHGGLSYGPIGHMTKNVMDPLAAVVARPNMSLVIPYRKGKAKTTAEPLHTLATRESAALVAPALDVADCYFRMLNPREHLRAQRFPDTYIVTGNKSEQTMQAGNAVSSNVAQWLGGIAAQLLGGLT